MAHFNTGGGSSLEEGVCHKLPSQFKHASRSPLIAKMASLENKHSGQALTTTNSPAPKSVFQKSVETASREDVGNSFPKPQSLMPKENHRDGEASGPESSYARPLLKRPPINKFILENKVKQVPDIGSPKPPWVKDGGPENITSTPQLPFGSKPKIHISALHSRFDQGTLKEPPTPSTPKLPQSSIFKPLVPVDQQITLSKQGTVTPESVSAVKVALNSSNYISPKPHSTPKPSFMTEESERRDELVPQKENDDPSAPKKKALPNVFILGNPPLKPNRPPHVNLQTFRTGGQSTVDPPSSPTPDTSSGLDPPPPCHLSQSGIINQAEQENYDDVGALNLPPPPPPGGHPNQINKDEFSYEETYEDLDERWSEQEVRDAKEKETNERENEEKKNVLKEESSDEEMYEDLDKKWSKNKDIGSKETKGQEKKSDKEEKKRLEQERKVQKAREKKEQEAKKKFKLSERMEVIHVAKAHFDSKGGKSDLPLKQGETIDIMRIVNNPDGRWLARNNEGNYGYVRIEAVDIDYDLLKQRGKGSLLNQPAGGTEVYDDVAVCSGLKEQAEDVEIYDDVEGPNSNRFLQPSAVVSAEDQIYDDVETQSAAASALNSTPQLTSKGMQGEMDPKKKKKFEKEEKEFRKKFKFEGEIQVLYELTVAPTLANKKWGNKELPLKPGEVIDVITKPSEGKLIGRNRDGKFGYVSMVNVANDGGDIYDDIGEDCIYDND